MGFAPVAPATTLPRNVPAVRMESKADLAVLAEKANPLLKFWDPLNLSGAEFWGKSEEYTIGFLRHAEIKHRGVGREALREGRQARLLPLAQDRGRAPPGALR